MRVRELVGMAAIAVAPLPALGYTIARAFAPPNNTPAKFEHRESSSVVACVGASTMHGRLGFDVVGALQARLGPSYQVVNAGVNGDLAWNALSRIDDVIDCNPDFVIVLVGSNDVLASANTRSEARFRRLKKLPERPTLDAYRQSLHTMISELRQRTRAQIGLCSLPPIGERLDTPLNGSLDAYNAVIREIAHEPGVEYLPIHEELVAALSEEAPGPRPAADGGSWSLLRSAVEHYVLGRSFDAIGKRRGYALFSDGVHLSSHAGTLLALRFEAFVRARAVSDDTRAELL